MTPDEIRKLISNPRAVELVRQIDEHEVLLASLDMQRAKVNGELAPLHDELNALIGSQAPKRTRKKGPRARRDSVRDTATAYVARFKVGATFSGRDAVSACPGVNAQSLRQRLARFAAKGVLEKLAADQYKVLTPVVANGQAE